MLNNLRNQNYQISTPIVGCAGPEACGDNKRKTCFKKLKLFCSFVLNCCTAFINVSQGKWCFLKDINRVIKIP